ncbi:MAG TPA: hypothetical protein VGE07_07475 [Herpetosiphonaceae bacterium]
MEQHADHGRRVRIARLANHYNELSHQLEEADPARHAEIETERAACLAAIAGEMGYAPGDQLARGAILDALDDPATFHRWKELLAVLDQEAGP